MFKKLEDYCDKLEQKIYRSTFLMITVSAAAGLYFIAAAWILKALVS